MFFREVRLWILTGLFVAVMVTMCWAFAEAACVVETARPASSFLWTDPIQFTLHTDCTSQRVDWTVTDYSGIERARGTIQVGQGASILRVSPAPGVGYYTLDLQFEDNSTVQKNFCVLPHPDAARGDGGLFGIGMATTSDRLWDAAWQMGARHVRSEFAWTEVEREKDTYRLDWVNEVASLAAERDMQLTVLTGHTPRHYSVRPADAEDNVARKWYAWQPERTIEWFRFIDATGQTLLPKRLSAEPVHPTDTLPRAGRALVRAWEVWSEADQNFYFGSWDRYLDMLRIAYCTLKQYSRVPVVYGSCGHMTQMKWTLWSGCADYLDRVAFHPYLKDPQWMMMHWYRNMPQALLAQGEMRETALTECGFHSPEETIEGEARYMLRVYTVLKALRETLHVRAPCLGGVFTTRDTPISLARIVDGRLEPRPAYVAFAVTRWLLESASYVGPLEAPDDARMEVFLRDGRPMVVGWTDGGTAEVTLPVSADARQIGPLGQSRALDEPNATVRLRSDAIAVLNVSAEVVAEAATGGIERVLTTELGHESPHDSRHIETLEEDLSALLGSEAPDQLREVVDEACRSFLAEPAHGAAAFFTVQRTVGEMMMEIVQAARRREELTIDDRNVLWRLARLTERVGAIADGVGERWWRMNNVDQSDLQRTLNRISRTRLRVSEATGGAECPFADRLLDRALSRLDEVRRSGGHNRGAWWAATLEARVGHALTAVERPQMHKVFATGVFSTATVITKGLLLSPGPGHKVKARVYNFLSEDISGHVRMALSEAWEAREVSGAFSAPAGEPSAPVELSFGLPDDPKPWVQRQIESGGKALAVDAPATLDLREEVALGGEFASVTLEDMIYRPYAGAYPSKAGESNGGEATPASLPRVTAPGVRIPNGQGHAAKIMYTCDVPRP